MADLSDVQNALGLMCQAALYPGQSNPSGNSLAGVPVLIQKGWPDPKSLAATMAAGSGQVSVYPQQTERNVTRYPREWLQTAPVNPHTFTLTKVANTVVVGGAQPQSYYPQNLAVLVNGKPYLYQPAQGDSLAVIAAALAVLIATDIPGTTSSAAVILIPTPARIGALRIGASGKVGMEVKRQERNFSLIVWASTPDLRDLIAAPIDAAIGLNQRLTLADGSKGRMIYKGSPFTDFDQKQGIYRRDLVVSVEYPTIASDIAPECVAARTDVWLNGSQDPLSTEGALPITDQSGSTIATGNPDIVQYN